MVTAPLPLLISILPFAARSLPATNSTRRHAKLVISLASMGTSLLVPSRLRKRLSVQMFFAHFTNSYPVTSTFIQRLRPDLVASWVTVPSTFTPATLPVSHAPTSPSPLAQAATPPSPHPLVPLHHLSLAVQPPNSSVREHLLLDFSLSSYRGIR